MSLPPRWLRELDVLLTELARAIALALRIPVVVTVQLLLLVLR